MAAETGGGSGVRSDVLFAFAFAEVLDAAVRPRDQLLPLVWPFAPPLDLKLSPHVDTETLTIQSHRSIGVEGNSYPGQLGDPGINPIGIDSPIRLCEGGIGRLNG